MTTRRTLTITLSPDWRAGLRRAGKAEQAESLPQRNGKIENIGAAALVTSAPAT